MSIGIGMVIALLVSGQVDAKKQANPPEPPKDFKKVEASQGGVQNAPIGFYGGKPIYFGYPPQRNPGDLTWTEIALSIGVLLYSMTLFGFFAWMKIQGAVWDLQSFKIMATLLLVTAALFVMTAAYTDKQAAPLFGLLGTLAGYILSKTDVKTDSVLQDTSGRPEAQGPV